jgi:hypothetical protein
MPLQQQFSDEFLLKYRNQFLHISHEVTVALY